MGTVLYTSITHRDRLPLVDYNFHPRLPDEACREIRYRAFFPDGAIGELVWRPKVVGARGTPGARVDVKLRYGRLEGWYRGGRLIRDSAGVEYR